MNVLVTLFVVEVRSHRPPCIHCGKLFGVGHHLALRIDSHPAVGAVHDIQGIVVLASHLTVNQFGSIQHIVAIAIRKEDAQVETFVGKVIVQTAVEGRSGIADNGLVVLVNDSVLIQILKLPVSGLHTYLIGGRSHAVLQRIRLCCGIVIEIIYLIQAFGHVAVELSQRLAHGNAVRALVVPELGFIQLHLFAGQFQHLVLIVREGQRSGPVEVFLRNVDRIDGQVHTYVLRFAGIHHHRGITRRVRQLST